MHWKYWLPALALACAALAAGQSADPKQTKSPERRPPGTNYEAPNGLLAFRVPQGWHARETSLGTTPVQVIEPESGDERIIVAVLPTTASSIKELVQQAVQLITQQLMPGLRPTSPPRYSQVNGMPVAEMSYSGASAAGQVSAFHAVMLRGQQSAGVLGLARADRAAMIEQQCRTVFQSLQLRQEQAKTQPAGSSSGQLAQLILGHWTWYHRTENARGRTDASVTREIWFYPGGRYKYVYATYVPNMPSDIDPVHTVAGSYQIQGNRLNAQADSGERTTFTIEVVNATGIKINGELYIRE